MSSPFDDTPEDLVRLRTTVHDWVEKAREALKTFYCDADSSFLRDSNIEDQTNSEEKDDHLSLTTTARSYMALAYADRCLAKSGKVVSGEWIERFVNFIKNYSDKINIDDKGLREIFPGRTREERTREEDDKDPKHQTNFDLAHVADFIFVWDYLDRFYCNSLENYRKNVGVAFDKLGDNVKAILIKTFSDQTAAEIRNGACSAIGDEGGDSTSVVEEQRPKSEGGHLKLKHEEGQVFLQQDKSQQNESHQDESRSRHFFVTLHCLRALAILDPEQDLLPDHGETLVEFARKFCIEQCFYAQRGNRHQQDVFRLTFAGIIYCIYGRHVDQDLCVAIVEALAGAQQENGSWPATHPIFRGKGSRPWHITSHEIALCLTWLYFEPRVPDVARPALLAMMEKYFTNWVIPTFTHVRKKSGRTFKGWFNDHTITHDFAEGWATAIVCHFLANYHSVLDDHINRRVIESLGLQASSSKYLIDKTEHESSPRWLNGLPTGTGVAKADKKRATWPDLPPFSWHDQNREPDSIAKEIRSKWYDPSPGCKTSEGLAANVLKPIFERPGARPDPNRCAGVLSGPPGTGKTRLVKTLAKLLGWPRVTVPASVIFERGFDLMEARASEVFRRLNYLAGCVIFFDEFEEFFKHRGEDATDDKCFSKNNNKLPIHDRTIAAFTTSAMLPRLQELHNVGRSLIFLATNHVGKIDPAIIRAGRFDFLERIGHPSLESLRSDSRDADDIGVESHLTHLLRKCLKELNLEAGEDNLNQLTGVMRKALSEDKVTKAVREMNKALRKHDDQTGQDETPFHFIAKAVDVVAGRQASGTDQKETDLINTAVDSIMDSIKRAENGRPPSLSELDQT